MAATQIFGIISDKFNVDTICTEVSSSQEEISTYMPYCIFACIE
jgi:hypothetical protein